MSDKKWWVVGGLAVIFFLCMGMTFIPLALGMGRQVMYYPPMAPNGDAPAPAYPMAPIVSRRCGGRGLLLVLPMLACVAFPLGLLALGSVFIARRHRWAAMHGEGAEAHWRRHPHHWRHYCDPAPHPAADDKPAREEA